MDNCQFCNKELLNKNNKFCDRSCAASFNNLKRSKEGYSLKDEFKILNCLDCNVELVVSVNSSNTIRCKLFYKNKLSFDLSNSEYNCIVCNKLGIGCVGRKYCDECLHEFLSEQGRISVNKQKESRRSKNEKHFAELCQNYFGFNNILLNEPIFDGRDADVIIKNLKVAVLWNGKWHYEKITEKHSVAQVQNRDRIKVNNIIKCGYIPYIIKDMGSENSSFVKEEFSKFIEYSKLV